MVRMTHPRMVCSTCIKIINARLLGSVRLQDWLHSSSEQDERTREVTNDSKTRIAQEEGNNSGC